MVNIVQYNTSIQLKKSHCMSCQELVLVQIYLCTVQYYVRYNITYTYKYIYIVTL